MVGELLKRNVRRVSVRFTAIHFEFQKNNKETIKNGHVNAALCISFVRTDVLVIILNIFSIFFFFYIILLQIS